MFVWLVAERNHRRKQNDRRAIVPTDVIFSDVVCQNLTDSGIASGQLLPTSPSEWDVSLKHIDGKIVGLVLWKYHGSLDHVIASFVHQQKQPWFVMGDIN